jgi:hypothetical protein
MSSEADGHATVSAEKAENYEDLMPLLEAMANEFRDATKKKPDAVLNKKKVSIVNRLLVDVLKLLDGEPQRRYLDMLDEDDLPQNSDVSLMMGQIIAAMEAFKARYHYYMPDFSRALWATPEIFEPDNSNEEEDEE